MKPRTRSRTPFSIGSNQLSKSIMSAATAAAFVIFCVMAWSPFQRSNAGIVWVRQPGDYANQIPTKPATAPAAGYAHTNVGQAETGDQAGADAAHVGVYASWRPGPWHLSAALAGGFYSIQTSRLSMIATPSTAAYGATTFSAAIDAAHRFEFAALPGVVLEPMTGLVFTHLVTNAFNESGSVFFDLAANAASVDALKTYAGARAAVTWRLSNGVEIVPEIRGRVVVDLLNDPRAFTARFLTDPTATPFSVTGLQPQRVAGLLGASLTLRITPLITARASYDAEVRGADLAHYVKGGISVRW